MKKNPEKTDHEWDKGKVMIITRIPPLLTPSKD